MNVGFWEIIIVSLVVFVLFGGGKIKPLMEDLAKGIKTFKDTMKDENAASTASITPSPAPITETTTVVAENVPSSPAVPPVVTSDKPS